jgi:hypothetical protein
MKSLLFLLLSTLVLGISSCNLKTYEGEETTEKRSANKYRSVEIRGPFQVTIDEAMGQGVSITAPSDAMVDIRTEVVDNELIIDLESSGITTQTFQVKIANAELDRIAMYGSGFFKGTVIAKKELTLDVSGSGGIDVTTSPDKMEATVSGSGYIEATGSVQDLEADVSGSGGMNFENLVVQDADVNVSGSGFVSLHVDGKLEAAVSGSGMIRYSGSPTEIDKSVTGSGGVESF